jgi:hypothetical protein
MELRVGEIGSHVYAAASRVLNPSNSILADNIDEQKRERHPRRMREKTIV